MKLQLTMASRDQIFWNRRSMIFSISIIRSGDGYSFGLFYLFENGTCKNYKTRHLFERFALTYRQQRKEF